MNETGALDTSHAAGAVAAPPVPTVNGTPAAPPETPAQRDGGAPSKRRSLAETARSAGLRAARTFLQAFLAVITAGPVLHLGIPTYKAGLTAGLAAVLALAQRLLDDTAVPTIPRG